MKNKRKYILHIICAFLAFFCTIGVGYSIWTYDQYVFNNAEKEVTKSETYAQACVITSSETKYFYKFATAVNYANAITDQPVEVKAVISQKIDGTYVSTTITVSENMTINSNVTLTLPYFNGDDSNCVYRKMFDNDFDTEAAYDSIIKSANPANAYTTYKSYSILKLSIATGYTLTNYGTINIGGRQDGSGGGSTAGFTYGGSFSPTASTSQGSANFGGTTARFAEIVLNGSAKYISYGKTVCFGFIRGAASGENVPEIACYSGSQTYIPFVVVEHRGGTTFSGLSSLRGSPFNRLYFPNLYLVNTKYFGSSKLFAFADLQASSHNNRCTINLIGPDATYMFNTNSASDSDFCLENYFSYKAISYTSTMTSEEKSVTIPRHTLTVYGSFTFNYLKLSVSFVTLSTASCYFPLSAYWDVTLRTVDGVGSATVTSETQKVKVLPGGSLKIEDGVTANLTAIANYEGEDADRSKYKLSSDSKFDGIEGRNGAKLYELIDCDGQIIVDGTLKANTACGVFSTSSTTGILQIVSSNSDTLYEVSPSSNSFYSFSSTAKGVLYNIDGLSTLNASSKYNADTDHWDGSGVTYPITFINVHEGGSSFDESKITDNTYPTTVTTSVTLPTPSYDGDYIFAGYYGSTDFTNIINPGTRTAGDLSDGFSTANHMYTIYVRWVDSSAEKVTYKVSKYDGGSSETIGEETIALVGSSYTAFELDRRSVSFGASTIDVYTYDGWIAEVYADNTQASLIDTITITNNEFEFSSANGVSDGNFILFKPVFEHNSYSAPAITVTCNTATLSSSNDRTGKVTGTVTNYRDDVFDVVALFASADTENVTVGETTIKSRDGYTVVFETTATNVNTSGTDTGSTTIALGVIMSITVDGVLYSSSSSERYYGKATQQYQYSNSCLLADSVLITKDGEKLAKDITVDDYVLTFNHFTGKYEYQKIAFVVSSTNEAEVTTLTFSDGNTMKIAIGHGLFNLERNRYEIYYGNEFDEHIGEHFVRVVNDGNEFINSSVELVKVEHSVECVDIYSPISSYNINIVADNMLNIPDDVEGMFEMYSYNDDLSINVNELMPIIMQYGLWSYDDFKDYAPEYAFEIMNFKYIKAALLSRKMTVSQVNHLLKVYLPMIVEQNGLDWDCEHQKYLPDDYVQRMLEN